MITATIEEYLHQTFQKPVVYGLGQTSTTGSIEYSISDLKVQTRADFSQTVYATVSVYMRNDNGFDSIGYLSAKISASKTTGKGWSVKPQGSEYIRDMTPNDKGSGYPDSLTLGLNLVFEITRRHDQIKEQINQIDLSTSVLSSNTLETNNG